jgi:hypothetical protein
MLKIILFAAGALALAACGTGEDSADQLALDNGLRAVIDERALAEAVNHSIDREAVKDLARGAVAGAVAGAVQDGIPAEVRAVGAVVNEEALVSGIDQAVIVNALSEAAHGAVRSSEKSAGGE